MRKRALFEGAVGSEQDRRDEHPRTHRAHPTGLPVTPLNPAGGRLARCGHGVAGLGNQCQAFHRADFRTARAADARLRRSDRRDETREQGQQGKENTVHRSGI